MKIEHPEWSKNATIYELNTRQLTAEGTFRAAEAHLPRIRALGVDIVWLMPIHAIGGAMERQVGATMIHVPNSAPAAVFSFVRQNAEDEVFATSKLELEPWTYRVYVQPAMGAAP